MALIICYNNDQISSLRFQHLENTFIDTSLLLYLILLENNKLLVVHIFYLYKVAPPAKKPEPFKKTEDTDNWGSFESNVTSRAHDPFSGTVPFKFLLNYKSTSD